MLSQFLKTCFRLFSLHRSEIILTVIRKSLNLIFRTTITVFLYTGLPSRDNTVMTTYLFLSNFGSGLILGLKQSRVML